MLEKKPDWACPLPASQKPIVDTEMGLIWADVVSGHKAIRRWGRMGLSHHAPDAFVSTVLVLLLSVQSMQTGRQLSHYDVVRIHRSRAMLALGNVAPFSTDA